MEQYLNNVLKNTKGETVSRLTLDSKRFTSQQQHNSSTVGGKGKGKGKGKTSAAPPNNKDTNISKDNISPEFIALANFKNLRDLSMVDVGCASLHGFPHLPNLTRLILNENRITSVDPLVIAGLQKLKYLDLSNNKITEFATVDSLAKLKSLQHLYLLDCPVTNQDEYREMIFEMLPSLITLDGQDINGEDIELTDFEAENDLTDEQIPQEEDEEAFEEELEGEEQSEQYSEEEEEDDEEEDIDEYSEDDDEPQEDDQGSEDDEEPVIETKPNSHKRSREVAENEDVGLSYIYNNFGEETDQDDGEFQLDGNNWNEEADMRYNDIMDQEYDLKKRKF